MLEAPLLVPGNNLTGFKGVARSKRSFEACVWEAGVKKHLGNFPTPEEAALCYSNHIGAEAALAAAAPAMTAAGAREVGARRRIFASSESRGCYSEYGP